MKKSNFLTGNFPHLIHSWALICLVLLLSTPATLGFSQDLLLSSELQTNQIKINPRDPGSLDPTGSADSLLLTFAGDLMAHAPSFRMHDYSKIYQGLRDILKQDDLSFVNLETVVDPMKPYQTFPFFNVHPGYVEAAVLAGFEVFSLSNNHTNDHGIVSTLRTYLSMDRLHQNFRDRVFFSGIHRSPEDPMKITPIYHQGWKIGFIAVTAFINEWVGNERTYMVPYWDQEKEEALVTLVREQRPHYDFIVLSYHGGTEYSLQPQSRKLAFMRRLYLAGADIVWGHHPHVLQPWEVQYAPTEPPIADLPLQTAERPGSPGATQAAEQTQALGSPRTLEPASASGSPIIPERRGLIMPSLGNFVSGQTWFLGPGDGTKDRAYTGDSVLLRVRVRRRVEDDGTKTITIDHPVPILITTQNIKAGDLGQQGTFVRLLSQIIQDQGLSSAWRRFFTNRLSAINKLLSPSMQRDNTPF